MNSLVFPLEEKHSGVRDEVLSPPVPLQVVAESISMAENEQEKELLPAFIQQI